MKTIILVFSVSLLLILPSAGQQNSNLSPLVVNPENRNTISLNGRWHIIIDPYRQDYSRNQKTKNKSDRVEYNFDTSPVLNVPGDWNTQMKELYYYEGAIWYEKSFQYAPKPGKRVFLYFGGVNYHAIVYLNGNKIGEHVGGYTPFNFEITGKLENGGNFITMQVDNVRKKEGVPTLKTDWWNYGGITRSVDLVEVPDVFIRDYFIHLVNGSTNKVEGWAKLNKAESGRNISLEIPEVKVKKEWTTDNQGKVSFSFKVNLALWSPRSPQLYHIFFTSGKDTINDQVGFRSIETAGDRILLNGKPVFLRGVCIHEEAPYRTGRATNEEDARTLLGWAKELGCNFVRLAHYPHNENMIRMAEKMGIMVWSEIPVYWSIDFGNPATYNNAENQLNKEITRDKNRAPVIIWSMANETPINQIRNDFLRKLIHHAREMDETRLISAALLTHHKKNDPNTLVMDDPLAEIVDVLSFNEYVGWYDGLPEKCEKVNFEINTNKPVIISEFGGAALQGYFADKETRWSENYQEYLYTQQIPMLDKIPHLSGTTPWILMDFRSPNRNLPGIQDGWNRKGLISEQGIRKRAFFVMQQWYMKMKNKLKI